jgi:hypothetical protein
MLPPEDGTRLRPDRALGRHGVSSGGDFSPEYERDDVSEVGDTRTRAQTQPTAEQLSPPARRSDGLFDTEVPEAEVPEAARPGRRRTGLFDAEQEGWT